MASIIGIGGIAFPILALVLAIIVSPIGLATSSQCNIFSASNCSLKFNSNSTVVLSTTGYSLYSSTYQSCQQLTRVANIPVLGYLTQLPLLSNVYDFFASIGGAEGYVAGGQSGPLIFNSCSQQVGNILVFHYTGQDLVFLLIGVIISSAAIAALSSVTILGSSGMNAAGTYIVFMVASLAQMWLVLMSFAFPTFAQMPSVIGGILYTLLTLTMAFAIMDTIS